MTNDFADDFSVLRRCDAREGLELLEPGGIDLLLTAARTGFEQSDRYTTLELHERVTEITLDVFERMVFETGTEVGFEAGRFEDLSDLIAIRRG